MPTCIACYRKIASGAQPKDAHDADCPHNPNVKIINIEIGGIAHKLDTSVESYAVVSRDGPHPFDQAYECHDEAKLFYATLVGAAYVRTFHKDFKWSRTS